MTKAERERERESKRERERWLVGRQFVYFFEAGEMFSVLVIVSAGEDCDSHKSSRSERF